MQIFGFLFAALLIRDSLCDFDLLILHNNDMHGRFEETSRSSGTCKKSSGGCYGGFARLAHLIREARKDAEEGKGPNVIYLNAGDTYTGTPWFTFHKSKIASAFINILKPDAISLGNHEFDFGVAGLLPFVKNLSCPLVTANLNLSDEPELLKYVNKSVILDVKGHKIGVIGYLTPETKLIAQVDGVKILDEVKVIKAESENLKAQGVNIIVALGHSGFETDKLIAQNVPLVDVVVGGHTNTFLWNGKEPDEEKAEGPYPFVVKQESGKEVPVVQAYAYTKYLGKLYLTFNEKGDVIKYKGNPIFVTPEIKQETDVLNLLETFRPALDNVTKRVWGKSRVKLESATCRLAECNFGNLITDALIAYKVSNYGGNYWTDTPIAVLNGGGIRMSLEAGPVTGADFLGVLPFNLQFYSVSLNGSDLIKMLETSVRSNGETSRGEFLQVSGLQVVYDLSKPRGERVVEVKTRCGFCDVPRYEKLDEKKSYRILVNSFMFHGGDGYDIFKEMSFDGKLEDSSDLDIISWYMDREKFIFPDNSGRISFVQENNKSSGASRITGHVFLSVILLYLTKMALLV